MQHPDASLATVGDMAQALTPFLGTAMGNLVFGAGVLGAGMVAAIVCSLAFAWGLGEVTGYRRSLEYRPFEARWFYGVYTLCVIGGAIVVAVWPDLVSLNVGVQVMNALMLPLVLGFLIALAVKALPQAHRLRGWYLWAVLIVTVLTCALGRVRRVFRRGAARVGCAPLQGSETAMRNAAFDVRPIAGAIGAELHGIDLSADASRRDDRGDSPGAAGPPGDLLPRPGPAAGALPGAGQMLRHADRISLRERHRRLP